MKKDVLFIIHDLYQEDNVFPLGIAYLVACLEKEGYTSEVYCMDVFHYTNEDLAKKLQSDSYELIGLDFMAARFKETITQLCETINKNKGNAWLVLGGHGPSPIPEYMLKKTGCDVVVIGEAEQTILKLLDDKKKGINKKIYDGIPVKSLDEIPTPAWEYFPMDVYTTNIKLDGMEKDEKLFHIISSRGCINRCTFCYRMENGIRLRKIKNVVDEMKTIHDKYGVTVFQFLDELFLISKKRLFEFKNELELHGLHIKFTANARVDIIDEEVVLILKEIGCILLNVGFESSSQDVLNHMKKNVLVEDNIRVLELCKKHNLRYGLNFIWGYPEDTHQTLVDNVNLIKKYNTYAQLRTIRPVTPYPGCELYYEAIKKNLINGPDDFFDKFKNSDLITINFTRYTDDECYKMLFYANVELIKDYYLNIDMSEEEKIKNGTRLIQNLAKLYSGEDINFRGARHYDNK